MSLCEEWIVTSACTFGHGWSYQANSARGGNLRPGDGLLPLRSAAGPARPYPPGVTDVGAVAGAAAPPDAGRDLFLAGIERALQPLDDPAEIMATVARLVGEQLACDRCAYAEAEPDEDHFTMTGSYARGLPPLHGRMAMSDFSAETLRCMRAGEPYVVADAFTDERVLPQQRDIYRRTGITAVVCVPLHKAGRFVAAMAVHQARPRVWTDAEIDLLTTVVTRCWESVQRVHALDALRENEERYRLLVERATDGIWLVDEHGRYLDVNPAACEMLGYTRAEHLALRIADVVAPDELPRLTAQLQAMHDGQVADRGVGGAPPGRPVGPAGAEHALRRARAAAGGRPRRHRAPPRRGRAGGAAGA